MGRSLDFVGNQIAILDLAMDSNLVAEFRRQLANLHPDLSGQRWKVDWLGSVADCEKKSIRTHPSAGC